MRKDSIFALYSYIWPIVYDLRSTYNDRVHVYVYIPRYFLLKQVYLSLWFMANMLLLWLVTWGWIRMFFNSDCCLFLVWKSFANAVCMRLLLQLVVFVVFALMLNTNCCPMRGGVSTLALQNRQERLFIHKDIRESATVFNFVEFGTLNIVLFESRHV